jgi:hypothetical protein
VNFNSFAGAILIIVISLVIRSGSAFADGKAEVVGAVNWSLVDNWDATHWGRP